MPIPIAGSGYPDQNRAHIYFKPDGPQVIDNKGDPSHVLTIHLEDEYRLFENLKDGEKTLTGGWRSTLRPGLRQQAWERQENNRQSR